jgi:Family of unknown function (DUF6064)
MSEWWTYSLSDFLLFSPRTYYRLFELYNLAIWPMQLVALAGAVAILAAWRHGGHGHGRIVAGILAACWLWVAWAYLLWHYEAINWAASYFAVGFALQAVLLLWLGVARDRLRLRWWHDAPSPIGLGLFVFAVAAYPLIAPLLGRSWLQAEIFGVAPDPTVVATLGLLLGAERPSWRLMPIPLMWCAISGATLWTMESPDAPVLPTAAVLSLGLLIVRTRRTSSDPT